MPLTHLFHKPMVIETITSEDHIITEAELLKPYYLYLASLFLSIVNIYSCFLGKIVILLNRHGFMSYSKFLEFLQ